MGGKSLMMRMKKEEHQEDILQKMWKMRIDGDFCDTHIVLKGNHIKCHKNVLAASSEYFQKMLEHSFNENKESVCKIVLNKDYDYNFSSEVVEVVLHYIYLGRIPEEMDLKMIQDVFILSHMWLLTNIQDNCTNIMQKNITIQNFGALLKFAAFYNNVCLEEAVIDFIRRNLPHIYKSEEFPEIDKEQFFKILEDPHILCHENCLWLEATKYWAQHSETKLYSALARIPVNYLSQDDVKNLLRVKIVNKSNPLLKMVRANLLKKEKPDKVYYYVKDKFHCKEEVFGDRWICKEFTPGCFVQYQTDKVIMKDVVITSSSLEEVLGTPTANHYINGASQVVHNNQIFFSFHTRYNADIAETLNKAIFVYSMTDRNWHKIDIPIDPLFPASARIDISCMSCDEHSKMTTKILHLEQSILYLFMATGNRRILLSLNLEFKEAEWEIKFVREEPQESSIYNDIEFEAIPTWRDTKILKIVDERVSFFGQVLRYEDMGEMGQAVFDLHFDNDIFIVSNMLGSEAGISKMECRLALMEKNSLEKAVIYSTDRYENHNLWEKTMCRYQLYNIEDTSSETILHEEFDNHAASIDIINGVLYTITASSCMSYNLQTKVRNNLPLEKGTGSDCEIKKFATLDQCFETPGFEVSNQKMCTNES